MIDFYEDRAGVRYADPVYTQVLAAGGVEQEMSSFTALRETYGRDVLANERAIWLAAHELAHQWWGNMVTNRDWTHFLAQRRHGVVLSLQPTKNDASVVKNT